MRIDVPGLDLRDDIGLKIRDQPGRVRIAAIRAITQMLEQPLQEKQITEGERLILAGRRHVASRAREGGKDFARGAFAVPIEVGAERGRPTLGDRMRDPSRMFIRRRGLWLGSAHQAPPRIICDDSRELVSFLSELAISTHKIRALGVGQAERELSGLAASL